MNYFYKKMAYRVTTYILPVITVLGATQVTEQHSVARQWNDELLEAIRQGFARPTVHARDLYHTSAAMWDAWAAYGTRLSQVFHEETGQAANIQEAREEAISYASYRIIGARFANSPGADAIRTAIDAKMDELGFDKDFTSTEGDTPAALGNRIAATVLDFGASDGPMRPTTI
jgi:hypothetical protein